MRTQASDRIPIAAPDLGPEEEAAVIRVLRSGHIAQGPEVAQLEAEFAAATGVDHAVAVSNGTTALQAALWVSGIRDGDEVLVPSFTFAATANAVVAVGATPVCVDVGDDLLIDIAEAEGKITPSTRAIIPVHLYGLMADMRAVSELASLRGLAVIEDAAQAHLAKRDGVVAGASGTGAFSLYATKNMTSGEGGLVTAAGEDTADSLRRFRNHGMDTRYHHTEWGLNLRMTDLAAAIARVQLAKLPDANETRRSNAAFYDEHLSGFFARLPVPSDAEHVYHQYVVRVPAEARDAMVERLQADGVGADVHYPIPVNRQPSFEYLGDEDGSPNAYKASLEVLALPVHPRVDGAARSRVVEIANRHAEELS